ncbi:MAG: hypothetical protein ACREQA_18335 [Candidatus Binatia bacterium]
MHLSRSLLLAICLTVGPVFFSEAQDRTPSGESRAAELVEQLKDVIQRAERNRTSDPRLIQQLRELVRRYDWPWRVSLLYDDFRDGDYTANPSWVVNQGDFRVTRGLGLRTVFAPAAKNHGSSDRRGEMPVVEFLGEVFRGISERGSGSQPPSPSLAEIYTELLISNAFALKLQMTSRGNPEDGNRLEFGLFQGQDRSLGYRLVYEPGKTPAFTLLRIAARRSAVIEIYDLPVDMEDGNSHILEWRRNGDGEMVVLLDDREIIRTVDRGYGDSFDGFTIINKGGDYAFKQIAISGTYR